MLLASLWLQMKGLPREIFVEKQKTKHMNLK